MSNDTSHFTVRGGQGDSFRSWESGHPSDKNLSPFFFITRPCDHHHVPLMHYSQSSQPTILVIILHKYQLSGLQIL